MFVQSKHSFAYHLLHAGFLLGLLFNTDDKGDMFLRNVGWLSTHCNISQKTKLLSQCFVLQILADCEYL
jgi:hypothetical protein